MALRCGTLSQPHELELCIRLRCKLVVEALNPIVTGVHSPKLVVKDAVTEIDPPIANIRLSGYPLEHSVAKQISGLIERRLRH